MNTLSSGRAKRSCMQRDHTHPPQSAWEVRNHWSVSFRNGGVGVGVGERGGREGWWKIFLEMSTHQSSVGGILLSSFWQYITWVMRYCLLLIKLLEYSYMPNYAMLARVDRKNQAVYLRKEESGDNWAIVRQSIILIYSFFFSDCFILIRIAVDPESIKGEKKRCLLFHTILC